MQLTHYVIMNMVSPARLLCSVLKEIVIGLIVVV